MATAMALAGPAHAQQSRNLDLPRLEPSAPGDVFFSVPSPDTIGAATLRAGVLLDYAHDPLIIGDSNGGTLGHVVQHQLLLHVSAALALADRVAVSFDLPFALVNEGDGTFEAGTFTGADAFVSPSGTAVGDLRIGARLRLFGSSRDPVGIAIGGYLWVPTATRDEFLTDTKVRGQAHVLVGGRIERFVWTALVGPTFRSAQTYGGVRVGSQLAWGGGAGLLLGPDRKITLGVESTGGATLVDTSRVVSAEALLGLKIRVLEPLEIGVAGGRGFAHGLGTPDFRGLFTVAYAPGEDKPDPDSDGDGVRDSQDACPSVPGIPSADPRTNGCPLPPPSDRDHDGIVDAQDACPNEPGPASADPTKNGCPPRDADKDGILDDVDACPTEAGPASDDPKKNGCPVPPDADGDGIPDRSDACPMLAGVKSDNPAENGCPPDSDGDGFRDDQDACPHEKGVDSSDPAKRGCPKLVRVTSTEIVILEQVEFDTNKAKIKPASDALLQQVAEVLKEHPEIVSLEVQGHTDARGKPKHNVTLSQARADAVVAALVSQGIAAGRLTARGYGQDVPLASNATEEGRQKNRRVQFVVTSKRGPGDQPAPPFVP
jgi:outer membrane protein OmpA-like peptidoglycan-associated protein